MVSAVIVSAGRGTRMKHSANVSKQHIDLLGKSVISRTIEKFLNLDIIDEIILVINKLEEEYFHNKVLPLFKNNEKIKIVFGGSERFESAFLGIKSTSSKADIVIVHDGVRPFVRESEIINVVEEAKRNGSAVVAVKAKDTIKLANDNVVDETINREEAYIIQTPQAFNRNVLIEAYNNFNNKLFGDNFFPTDDSSVVEKNGNKVYVVEGSYQNIKITTFSDIVFGEAILKMEEYVD